LVELLGGDDAVVKGPEGGFLHELLVPFVRKSAPLSKGAAPSTEGAARSSLAKPVVARTLVPGSEWLYAKIYTGTATADAVLREVVAPLVERTRAEGLASGWFFIRYADPHSHLRVRFRGDPTKLASELQPRLHAALAPLVADGRVWRVELDTYEREMERYGGAVGISLAERLFEADSDAVLRVVARTPLAVRPQLVVRGAHALLTDLGFELPKRLEIATSLRERYGVEHGVDVAFSRALGAKFRTMRADLDAAIAVDSPSEGLREGFAALRERSARLAPVVCDLRAAAQSGQLDVSLEDLAGSYVHMHVIRMLRAQQRAQELVVYDFLQRLWESEIARR
jgi:thiopeptide-type bacteriocin biosynthesis protein